MIFFRIDLSVKHGLGHYNRVKSFINYLNIKKYKIVVDKLPNQFYFKNEKKNIVSLYQGSNSFINEKSDANLFLKVAKNKNNNSIIVKDSYRLGYVWEKHIYKNFKKIISIDDLFKKKHFVDIYINHSPIFFNQNEELLKKIKLNNKKRCIFLLGPKYALFNSNLNKKEKIVSDFVFYNGGSGNLLVYEKVIKKLSKIKKKQPKIILIVGPYAKNYRIIGKKFKNYKNIKIFYQQKNILKFLIGTKIFLSSAGISMFESSFLKVPTLLFKMNYNQNLSGTSYEKLGHYFFLEKKDLKNSKKIVNLIYLMFKNRKLIKKMMNSSVINASNIKKNYKKYFKNIL